MGGDARRRSRVKRGARLTRERVVDAAVTLADESGLQGVTMRALGHALAVEAMSLYNHVTSKDDLLDGMTDRVLGEIELPANQDWRAASRRRLMSAHEVFLQHRWLCPLLSTRPGSSQAALRYREAGRGVLQDAGFPEGLIDSAWHTLEGYLHGFTLQRLNAENEANASGVTAEFAFGLDLILEGLVRRKAAPAPRAP